MIRGRAADGSPGAISPGLATGRATGGETETVVFPTKRAVLVMMMTKWLLTGGMAVAMAAAVAAGPARAASPTPINRFSDWSAQTYDDNGKTLCYATSGPKKQA